MPYKGLLLANSSRGTEFYFACILCPTARKRTITITGSLLPVGGFISCHESVSSFCKSWSANLSLTPAWRLFLFYSLPRHSLFYSPGSAGGCLCWPMLYTALTGQMVCRGGIFFCWNQPASVIISPYPFPVTV